MWFLLIKNWKLGVAGAAILAAVAYVAVIKLQLAVANRTVSTQAQEIAELKASTALQNQYVETWKQAAVKNSELAKAAQDRASILAASARSTPIPVVPPNLTCQERDSWLRDQLNSLLQH